MMPELLEREAPPALDTVPFGLTAIICTYNRKQMVERAVRMLLDQLPAAVPFEIVVVDNNSTDDTAKAVKLLTAAYPQVRYIFEKKQGLSNARNAGAAAARYEYLIYVDDDAYPTQGYLAAIATMIETHRPDLFGGPIYPDFVDGKPEWFPEELEVRKKSDVSGFSRSATLSGGNFGVRRDVLARLGGFDPKYGMVGNKVGMIEERLIVEHYRRSTPEAEQKVYYCIDCSLKHHTPRSRMSVGFQLKRIYLGEYQLTAFLLRNGIRNPKALRKTLWQRVFHRLRNVPQTEAGRDQPLRRSLYRFAVALAVPIANLHATIRYSLFRHRDQQRARVSAPSSPAGSVRIVQLIPATPLKDRRLQIDALAARLRSLGAEVTQIEVGSENFRDAVALVLDRGIKSFDVLLSTERAGLLAAVALRSQHPALQAIHFTTGTHLRNAWNTVLSKPLGQSRPWRLLTGLLRDRRELDGADEVIVQSQKERRYLSLLLGRLKVGIVPIEELTGDAKDGTTTAYLREIIARARVWASPLGDC